MNTDGILAEVWESKDSLSATFGHDLSAICREIYAEQSKRPDGYLIPEGQQLAEQDVADQPAAAVDSKPD